ncbi:MAG TPA: DUF1345 domain-containing protein [Rhizomicrobium sp.]|nr:DUF1345 domain-containing protein [Rhizomicrobium sp.]
MAGIWIHIQHHRWFYLAVLVAAGAWAVTSMVMPTLRLFVAGDAFYLSYLVLTASLVFRMSAPELRRRAATDDEGMILIGLITVLAVCFSLFSIFELLNQTDKPDILRLVLSIGSAPLAWFVLHTVAAHHYAHRYYADADPGPKVLDAGGLMFPDSKEPEMWDFLYYSFVIGMTAQVSDIQVTSTSMRKVTLIHSVISFFLNTVLIALAVNVAVALAQVAR